MSDYSTRQAAAKLGISHSVLSKYIVNGKIPSPKTATAGGMTIHMWSEEDIERVRELLPKIKNGRKTRYRKKQTESAKPKTGKQPQPRAAHGAPGSSIVPHEKNPASSTSRDK